MAGLDDQKRPKLASRRASGPSTSVDRGATFSAVLAMPDRLHRAPSPTEHTGPSTGNVSPHYQPPSYMPEPGLSKLTRSASSNAPTSTSSSRPHSLQSAGGSMGVGAGTNTTASPLNTPGDAPVDVDPFLAATKRSLTASPSVFDQGKATAPTLGAVSPIAQTDAMGQSEPQVGARDRADPAGLILTTTMKTKADAAWQKPATPLRWASASSNLARTSSSSPNAGGTFAGQGGVAGPSEHRMEGSDDLDSLTERLSMNDDGNVSAPSRSSTLRPEERSVELPRPPPQATDHVQHQHQHPTPPQPPPPLPLGPLPLSQPALAQHHQYHHQTPYYHPMHNRSPELYPASYQRSPMAPMSAMDPIAFEAFRATPDPYAPMYGLPPPSVASSSTPQSPTFAHHAHQGSADFMYPPSGYPHAMNTMAGLPGHLGGMMGPRAGPVGGPGGPRPPLPASSSAPNMIMQGMSPYPPQSPMLMSAGPSGMDRSKKRESGHLMGSFQGPVPIPASAFGLPSQWGATPGPGPGQAYMHGHSPSWSGSMDARSVGNGHQRMLSGTQTYGSNSMTFLPGSMSPPPPFYRPPGSGRMSMHSRSPSSFSQFSQQRSSQSDIQRSPLLEEFRSRQNKGRRFELSDIRGAIVEFSSDQHGSRFTQEKLDTASEEEMKMVFEELLPSAISLMTDVFGNYVIQKIVEHGTEEIRLQLVDQMQGHILSLSLGTYGCRVVQKTLEYVQVKEQMRIADELRRDILACVRDQNANHVVQKILERVSPTSQIDFIPQAFRNTVYSLAAHCYSCRVLQRIFEHCEESQKRPLIDELLRDTERLMHDQYGNYVIQWILQNASKRDKDVVIATARGNILRLSRHKFASNVVEQIIRAASQEERYSLIEEIMAPVQDEASGEATVGAVVMMKDQYGNYVLQRFLELSEGQQKVRLITFIKPALNNFKRFSSGYAKHLSAIERLLDTNIVRSNAGTMTSTTAATGDSMSDNNGRSAPAAAPSA